MSNNKDLERYRKKLQDILNLIDNIKNSVEPMLKQEEASEYSKKGIKGMVYNEDDPEHTEDILLVSHTELKNMIARSDKWRMLKSRTRAILRNTEPDNNNVLYVDFKKRG